MKLVSKIFKPCAFLLIALFVFNHQTQAAPNPYKKKDIEAMTAATDAFEAEYLSAFGVWQIVEYELSSGQAPTSQTKQQLQYVISSINGWSDEIANMAVAAQNLGHAHIMQDVSNIKTKQGTTLAAVKAVLDSILGSGDIDYGAIADANSGFDTIARLIDCIRREIQVITGGH